MKCLRLILRVFLATGVFGGFLIAQENVAGAATVPTATVSNTFAHRGDSLGVTYSVAVANASSATNSIGSVKIIRPSASWTITTCYVRFLSGWQGTVVNAGTACVFQPTDEDAVGNAVIPPGRSHDFYVTATTAPGTTYEQGTWSVKVDSDPEFGDGVITNASGQLTSWIDVFGVSDLVLARSASPVGSACPAPQKTGAVLEERAVVVCGINYGNAAVAPSSASQLGGTMIKTPGTFATGAVNPTTSPVVLGTFNPSVMTATVGSNLTTGVNLGPAGHQLMTFGGYNSFAPTLSVRPDTVVEGNSGTRYAIVRLNLSPAVNRDIPFTWHTANYNAGAPTDYQAVTAGTGSISRMSLTGVAVVQVNGDTTRETDELFRVVVDTAVGTTLSPRQADVVITDDDVPTASIGDTGSQLNESGNAPFRITLDRAVPTDTTVSFETRPTGAMFGANPLSDYTGVQRSVVIPANTTSVLVDVPVRQDNVTEQSEKFLGLISASSLQAKIGDGSGTATIWDNDSSGTENQLYASRQSDMWLSCSTVTATATEGGTATMRVGVKNQHANPVEVYYETVSGTASSGSDFVRKASSVVVQPYLDLSSFPTSALVSVTTTNDSLDEPTETFNVRVVGGNSRNVCSTSLLDPGARFDIVDND